jgi:hypothetical protein
VEELIRNGVLFGALLALALVGWRGRWRLVLLAVAGVLGLPLATWLQVLTEGWTAGVPFSELAMLAAWVVFSRMAAAAGGPSLRGPAWVVAPLLGALVGDWGAALLIAPLAPSLPVAGRWILGAMAGAMVLPIGTPAVLLIAPPADLGWLPLVLLVIDHETPLVNSHHFLPLGLTEKG